jgi:hypothetical protein
MTIRSIALILTLLVLAPPARAGEDGGSCEAERAELTRLRQSLESCSAEERQTTTRLSGCEMAREEARRAVAGLNGSLQTCRTDRDRVCGGAAALADVVGHVKSGSSVPAVPGCVSAAQGSAVSQVLEGHASAASILADLVAYLSGATDVPPQPRAANTTELRALVDRLAGNGHGTPPLVLRRVLVEAIERVAPRFWRRLMAGGRSNVDRWLSSTGPLDESLIAEIRAGMEAGRTRSSGASPAWEAALRGFSVYRDLAGCDRRGSAPRECRRALALQQVLENSGPLLVRQRVQEIWASPCRLGPNALLGWVRDLPASSAEIGRGEWRQIAAAVRSKMFACYLSGLGEVDRAGSSVAEPFPAWMEDRLPGSTGLTAPALDRIDMIREAGARAPTEEICVRAVSTLIDLEDPGQGCALAPAAARRLIDWFQTRGSIEGQRASFDAQVCARMADALWSGHRPEVQPVRSRPPVPSDLIVSTKDPGGAAGLRLRCAARAGRGQDFARGLASVVPVAAAAAEDVTVPPWSADPRTQLPVEVNRVSRALTWEGWARHLVARRRACDALGLKEVVCRTCGSAKSADSYDCQILDAVDRVWRRRTRRASAGAISTALLLVVLGWARASRRVKRLYGAWRADVGSRLRAIGLPVAGDWLRWLVPARGASLVVRLPAGPDWQRWGARAAVLRTAAPSRIGERDVARAAAQAQAAGATVAFLLHDEGASPDLKAVRGMLEWAAKGTRHAVQIVPLATERLQGARTSGELLDLIEQVSIRGNPFDVRGRLVSSSQFFDREGLVSGLIASAEAGQWVTITGLRRFGKSSLALEVARRLPGPSAYVDLAGFHDELVSSRPAGEAAASLLRYLLSQLHQSARERYGASPALPAPPGPTEMVDAAQMLNWLRLFVTAVRNADGGRTPPAFLLIIDEVEQALGVGPDRIGHSLDVLSTLVGRLRACLFESLAPSGCRFGVVFCGAAHPLLWAPLATLGGQSLMGAFQSVVVPRLPDEPARAMMRSLGARQGIRFTDEALEVIVRETSGIPILARRVGSAVLELYDPERAQHGGLGAVEIGVEGARASVRREEDPGAPLRVWVESEIGDPRSPAGAILRRLAVRGSAATASLLAVARDVVQADLTTAGVGRLIDPGELHRRSEEASAFVLRMLVEVGLLVPQGDPVSPEAMSFPDSIVRRVLSRAQGAPPVAGP